MIHFWTPLRDSILNLALLTCKFNLQTTGIPRGANTEFTGPHSAAPYNDRQRSPVTRAGSSGAPRWFAAGGRGTTSARRPAAAAVCRASAAW